MKFLYLSLFISVLLVPLDGTRCFAQDPGSDVVKSLVESMNWFEKAWKHSFELKVSCRRSDATVPQGEYSKTFSDNHSDVVRQLSLLNDQSTRDWVVSRSYGWSRLDMDSNNDIRNEEYKNAVYAKGNGEGEITVCRLPQTNCEVYEGSPSKLLNELFDVELDRLPITVLTMERISRFDFLDFLVDFCLEPANKQFVSKSEESVNGTTRIVYRLKVRQSDNMIYGVRIVVSQSGIDQGLVNEIHFGYLKKDEFNSSYISEEQLLPSPKIYAKTEWVQLTLGDSSQPTIVVPKKIAKREDSIQAVKRSKNALYDFDWKPLSDESKQKINPEEAKKKAEELVKDIDKILNR